MGEACTAKIWPSCMYYPAKDIPTPDGQQLYRCNTCQMRLYHQKKAETKAAQGAKAGGIQG